jgi:hypothetical protein
VTKALSGVSKSIAMGFTYPSYYKTDKNSSKFKESLNPIVSKQL